MTDELDALRRPFLLGALAVLAGIVCLGGVIAAFGSNADRPAGVAERWLTALSDTTRDGVASDARARMAELQEPGASIVDPATAFPEHAVAAADGKALFDSIQVGRPLRSADGAGGESVPVVVTPRAGDPVDAYVVLTQATDGAWRVSGFSRTDDLTAGDCGEVCSGFPLQRPEHAPVGFFVAAVALGVLIAAGCSAAIHAATPKGPATAAGG